MSGNHVDPPEHGHPVHSDGMKCAKCGRLPGFLPRYELTDVGDAERFWATFHPFVHFVHDEDCYVLWKKFAWVRDRPKRHTEARRWFWEAVGKELKEEAAEMRFRADDTRDEEGQESKGADQLNSLAEHIERHRNHVHSRAGLSAGLELFNSLHGVTISTTDLDRNPDLFAFPNGTFDLILGKLRDPNPADLISKVVDYDYDPAARAPLFLSTLNLFVPDRSVQAFLQRVAGRSLIWLNERRPLIILSGPGRNGKSTYLGALQNTIGAYCITADVATFLEKKSDRIENDLARMVGARVVVVRELPSGRTIDESIVKAVTGGDRITARHLFQDYFDFDVGFVLYMASNPHPIIGGGIAMRDRVFVVPFLVTIASGDEQVPKGVVKDDKRVPRKLLAERPGIFNWMYEGLKRFREAGFAPPETVRSFTQTIAEENLTIERFADECLLRLEPSAGMYLASARVYLLYQAWTKKHGLKPLSESWLGRNLSEIGFTAERFGVANDRGVANLAVQAEWIQSLIDGVMKDPTQRTIIQDPAQLEKSIIQNCGATPFVRKGAAGPAPERGKDDPGF